MLNLGLQLMLSLLGLLSVYLLEVLKLSENVRNLLLANIVKCSPNSYNLPEGYHLAYFIHAFFHPDFTCVVEKLE